MMSINRRRFLTVCSVTGASLLAATEKKEEKRFPNDAYLVVEAVQTHMFPRNNLVPSAGEFHAAKFLSETVMHPTYDRDIRSFVIEGARALQEREKQHFLDYDPERKRRHFENMKRQYMGVDGSTAS